MAVFTVTSRARTVYYSADLAPCCGMTPEVFTWTKGMGRGLIGVTCRNPKCKNCTEGVLAYASELEETWERWRNPVSQGDN